MARMQSRVFVDSNFFITRFNESDSLHSQALDVEAKLITDDPRLLISNLVFLEVVTVLSQKAGREIAISAGEHLKEGRIEFIHVDEQLCGSAWEIFKRIRKKNMGFVDCSHLAVMQAEGIKKFLTFDRGDFLNLRKTYDFSFY